MKFNFGKIEKQEPVIPESPVEQVKTQEQFDLEIEQEAAKLKTSVEELAKEIEAMGGPEKFKEKMEGRKYERSFSTNEYVDASEKLGEYSHPLPLGAKISNDMQSNADYLDRDAMEKIKPATAIVVCAIVLDIVAAQEQAGFSNLIQQIKEGSSDMGNYIMPAFEIFMATIGGAFGIAGIMEKIEANKVLREKNKHDLKLKMTDVK